MTFLDPITLSVLQNSLIQIVDEMDLVQEKTAFSPIISEGLDRANGIFQPDDGKVIAQGRRGLPLFIGVMQATVEAVIARGLQLASGDVIIVNDPYQGGTHLMDVRCVRPFFRNGRLWCFLANVAHWADIGGAVPGGFATSATEIQAEGLRVPPIHILKGEKWEQETLDLILANCRIPEERVGDLRSQVGALRTGERRLAELLDRYGDETVTLAIATLRERGEQQMRQCISAIPDGIYKFETVLDSDGVVDQPLSIRLTLTVQESNLEFDLSRSDPPCKGPLNTPWATTQSAIYIAVKHMFPETPVNAGCFTPIRIKRPVGTFLDAVYPRPCAGAASEASQRVCEAALGALGLAMPDRAYAGAFGTVGNLSLSGYDPQYERPYVMYLFSGGGYGGYADGDGHSNAVNIIAYSKSQPIEILERTYPVLFEEVALRVGSGGAGQFRGGLGSHFRLRLLRGAAACSFLMDKGRVPPYGVQGGLPGSTTRITLSQQGVPAHLPHLTKGSGFALQPGDWLEVDTPGGGGFKDPKERDPERVAKDVLLGYVTSDQASQEYGYEESVGVTGWPEHGVAPVSPQV